MAQLLGLKDARHVLWCRRGSYFRARKIAHCAYVCLQQDSRKTKVQASIECLEQCKTAQAKVANCVTDYYDCASRARGVEIKQSPWNSRWVYSHAVSFVCLRDHWPSLWCTHRHRLADWRSNAVASAERGRCKSWNKHQTDYRFIQWWIRASPSRCQTQASITRT